MPISSDTVLIDNVPTDENKPVFGEEIRSKFMLRNGCTFLNHGSFGCVPRHVHERQIRYLTEIESHPDIWFRHSVFDYLRSATEKVANFMGVEAKDTFLLQNVTKATNTVLKSFPFKTGASILITSLTYSAVKSATQVITEQIEGVKAYHLRIPIPIQCEDDIVSKYEDFLDTHPDVKFAIIDHITSPTAIVMPVKRLVSLCHEHNVVTLVDGAHAPGQLRFNIPDLDTDFYTGNLHKWVYTPRGCALLWINPCRRHAWFRPLVTSSKETHGLSSAFSYEGTKDDTAYICAMDGIDFYNWLGGIDAITKYTSELREKGVRYLEEIWGTKRLEVPDHMVAPNMQLIHLPRSHLIGSDLKQNNEAMMRMLVDRYGVQVAFVEVEGEMMVRVSVNIYNTMADFKLLGQAVDHFLNDLERA